MPKVEGAVEGGGYEGLCATLYVRHRYKRGDMLLLARVLAREPIGIRIDLGEELVQRLRERAQPCHVDHDTLTLAGRAQLVLEVTSAWLEA